MEASIVEGPVEPSSERITDFSSFMVGAETKIIYPVPYAGDEKPEIFVSQPFIDGDFWLSKPA